MLNLNIPASLTTKAGRALLQTQKHSPTIMLATGIVGAVGATVLACKATLKVEEVLDRTKEQLDDIKSLQHNDDYVNNHKAQDLTYVYVRNGVALVRLYAPAAALGIVSIGLITGSHIQLNRRNAATMAAYAALEKGFADYRKRVAAEFGEDKEEQLRYNAAASVEKGKDGKKKDAVRVGPGSESVYARFFDELCKPWSKEPEYNRFFLQCQQNFANHLLNTRGHVFLNEVYDMLDIPRSQAGAVVGWVLTKDGKAGGDNYVDFGIFRGDDPVVRDFVNGREGAILLDFNVDGVIYDKI